MDEQKKRYSDELVDEFLDDLMRSHENIETAAIMLEHEPENPEGLNRLFRELHMVKGNLGIMRLIEATRLVQGLEDILHAVRDQLIGYDSGIADLTLLGMDYIRRSVTQYFDTRLFPAESAEIAALLARVVSVPAAESTEAVADALLRLEPGMQLVKASSQERSLSQSERSQDLMFLLSLSRPLEQRSRYWQGRHQRMLELALKMNDLRGRIVDVDQLTAAIYMHDIGKAFLPLALLHKEGSLDADELALMRQHPVFAHDLLKRMGSWDLAACIVLQQHERSDGGGYPNGCKEAEICDGAKILGIVSAYDAISHENAHSKNMRRSTVRAVFEINRFAGSQFSDAWVDAFNDAVK